MIGTILRKDPIFKGRKRRMRNKDGPRMGRGKHKSTKEFAFTILRMIYTEVETFIF
jgi:hypothetical protein